MILVACHLSNPVDLPQRSARHWVVQMSTRSQARCLLRWYLVAMHSRLRHRPRADQVVSGSQAVDWVSSRQRLAHPNLVVRVGPLNLVSHRKVVQVARLSSVSHRLVVRVGPLNLVSHRKVVWARHRSSGNLRKVVWARHRSSARHRVGLVGLGVRHLATGDNPECKRPPKVGSECRLLKVGSECPGSSSRAQWSQLAQEWGSWPWRRAAERG